MVNYQLKVIPSWNLLPIGYTILLAIKNTQFKSNCDCLCDSRFLNRVILFVKKYLVMFLVTELV